MTDPTEQDEKACQLQRDADRLGEIWNLLCTKAENSHGALQEIILVRSQGYLLKTMLMHALSGAEGDE